MSATDGSLGSHGPHTRWQLPLIVAVGAGWRLCAFHFNDHVGQGDQLCYLQIARELLAGRLVPSVFPPGHPAFISLALALGGSPERAAQIVSLFFGCCLIPIGYLLARLAFDRPTALLAAGVIALHPELVGRSVDGMSETTFMVLLYGALLLLCGAVSRPRTQFALAATAGILLGVGYLTRPEGILYAGTLLLVIAAAGAVSHNRCLLMAGAAAALPLSLLVVSYVALVVRPQTHRWALSAKSTAWQRSYELEQQEGEAKRYSVSALRLGAYTLDQAVGGATSTAPAGLSAWLKRGVQNAYIAYRQVLPTEFDYLLVVLLAFGFLAAWGRPDQRLSRALLSTPFVMLLIVPVVALTARLFVPLIPCVAIWAAYGVSSMDCWTPSRIRVRRLQAVLLTGLALAYLKPNFDFVQDYYTGGVALEEKWAGAWVDRHVPRDAVVMERKSAVGFYAHRQSVTTPYAELATVISYARERGIGYLIVSGRHIALRPQLAPLLGPERHPGLPLLYEQPTPEGWGDDARIRVFRIPRVDGRRASS